MRAAGEEPAVPFRLDERVLRPRVAGFIAVGGSLTPQWKALALPVMHILTFSMQTAVVDQIVIAGAGHAEVGRAGRRRAAARAAQLGAQRRDPARPRPSTRRSTSGEPGLCPLCHLDVVVLTGRDGRRARPAVPRAGSRRPLGRVDRPRHLGDLDGREARPLRRDPRDRPAPRHGARRDPRRRRRPTTPSTRSSDRVAPPTSTEARQGRTTMTEDAIRCTCSSPAAGSPAWPWPRALLKAGHTVEVFERDADLNRKQGYYLHFNAIGGEALRRVPARRPLRALPRDLARVLRPARVDRAERPARRAHLAPHMGPPNAGPAQRTPACTAARCARSCPAGSATACTSGDAGRRPSSRTTTGVTVDAGRREHRPRRRAGRRRRHPLGGAHASCCPRCR